MKKLLLLLLITTALVSCERRYDDIYNSPGGSNELHITFRQTSRNWAGYNEFDVIMYGPTNAQNIRFEIGYRGRFDIETIRLTGSAHPQGYRVGHVEMGDDIRYVVTNTGRDIPYNIVY